MHTGVVGRLPVSEEALAGHDAQEIVVFRDDLQKRMRKLCLLKPNGGNPPAALC